MSVGKVCSKMQWCEQLWFLIHSNQAECQLITHPNAFLGGALCSVLAGVLHDHYLTIASEDWWLCINPLSQAIPHRSPKPCSHEDSSAWFYYYKGDFRSLSLSFWNQPITSPKHSTSSTDKAMSNVFSWQPQSHLSSWFKSLRKARSGGGGKGVRCGGHKKLISGQMSSNPLGKFHASK